MVADSFTALGAILIPLGYVLRLEFGKSWEYTAMVIVGLVILTIGFITAQRTEKQENAQRFEEHKVSNNRFTLLEGTLERIVGELEKLNNVKNENK